MGSGGLEVKAKPFRDHLVAVSRKGGYDSTPRDQQRPLAGQRESPSLGAVWGYGYSQESGPVQSLALKCPLRELPGPSKSSPQRQGPGYLHGAGRGLMGTGDGQDRGPSASGAPEPLLTKLRTSGTLGAEAEQKQAVDGRHSRQKVAE